MKKKKNEKKEPQKKKKLHLKLFVKLKKTMQKIPLKVWLVIFVICVGGLSFTGYKLYSWRKDNIAAQNLMEATENNTPIEEVIEDTELVNPPENKQDMYYSFVDMPLMSVDFDELLKTNPNTKAFLKVNGTNVNYPVVQASDNKYYLTHAFDNSKNGGGWVFLDYRNNMDHLSDNTIIYGHGRKNGTIFGSLKKIVNSSWYENSSNYTVYISTPKENTLWQVFSVYKIPNETYYLISKFGSEESHQKFINTMLERSIHNFNTQVTTKDKILTLSTCWNHDVKVVLHAKLIKRQIR